MPVVNRADTSRGLAIDLGGPGGAVEGGSTAWWPKKGASYVCHGAMSTQTEATADRARVDLGR